MIAVILLCAGAAISQADPPRFELHTTGEKVLIGSIQRMDRDGSVTLVDQKPVPGPEVVGLQRLSQARPSWPRTAHVVLFNGDRIVGTPERIDANFLCFRALSAKKVADDANDVALRFPLTAVSLLWLRSPDALEQERFATVFADERSTDRVVLRNGDVIAGTLIRLDAAKGELQIENSTDRQTIDLRKVVAVSFSTKLARSRIPKGSYAHLTLVDGSRLTVTAATISDDNLEGATLARERLRVALGDVSGLAIYGGKAVYLSDLKPIEYRYRSYLGEEFTWKADRNLENGELQLHTPIGVQTFDKGVSVHGECTLSYTLDQAYQRFECTVGLDPRLGARGSVELSIKVEGKEHSINDGKPLTMANGPLYLKLNVRGAKRLTLIVKAGDGGNVGDYVNWCDARLIRRD